MGAVPFSCDDILKVGGSGDSVVEDDELCEGS